MNLNLKIKIKDGNYHLRLNGDILTTGGGGKRSYTKDLSTYSHHDPQMKIWEFVINSPEYKAADRAYKIKSIIG